MADGIYFVVFPYLAFFFAVFGGVYRFNARRYTFSSSSSQLLENRALFWGSVPWHYGIILILLAHLIPIIHAPLWIWLHREPLRMFFFELAGAALGFLTLLGIFVLIARRIFNPGARAVTTAMDWVLLAALALQVLAGFYITFFYRWGSAWYVYTAVPWLRSLVSLNPHMEYITPLPWVLRLHAVNAFVIIGLFPFTRLVHVVSVPFSYLWRPYQIDIGYKKSREEGQPEGEGISRRNFFLKAVIGTLSAVSGLILLVPYIKAIISPAPLKKTEWSKVGDISSIMPQQPKAMNFEMESVEAYMHHMALRSVWVVKESGGELKVFSPICPHLGCHYRWDPGTGHFECPCHGSVFSITGTVLGGPAPRPLDTLPFRIENNILYVKWERFEVGIPQKVRI
ncbi:MAG: respiratory nitrate reductase subunit gamma [Nitrospiraceae bacterium]|nr:respiratory nitrate reductase subunit gamma [Nitrospiraceae bacterium]